MSLDLDNNTAEDTMSSAAGGSSDIGRLALSPQINTGLEQHARGRGGLPDDEHRAHALTFGDLQWVGDAGAEPRFRHAYSTDATSRVSTGGGGP